jgi:hypothetical protein
MVAVRASALKAADRSAIRFDMESSPKIAVAGGYRR